MLHSAMEKNENSTVYISNLSYNRDSDGVKNLFTPYGSVKYVKMIVDPKSNNSKGMAFVKMSSVLEATKAIKDLDGVEIDGRRVKVNFSIPQDGPIKKFYRASEKEDKKNNKNPVYKFKSK